MNFLTKIEDLINALLIKLGELIWKIVPSSVKNFFAKISEWKARSIAFIKGLPALILKLVLGLIEKVKAEIKDIDFKAKFLETYKVASDKYKENGPKKLGSFFKIFATPFLMVAEWIKDLSATQATLLLTFSLGSILAVIGIGFSGQKLVKNHLDAGRVPASVEEISYDRPGYYKKQTRHFDLTSLRLPVYVAQINEIRSVDVDFTATLSNRTAKMFLEKRELQLRDHFIITIEPSVASFPLEEEGKEILRKKVKMELEEFLKANNIDGGVEELKITYVLAN